MLISVLVAGTTLYAGGRIYKKRQKKKMIEHLINVPDYKHETRRVNMFTKLEALFSDPRDELLEELSSTKSSDQISKTEKKVNQSLSIAVASLSLAAAGTLIYPPLSLLSLPGAFYTTAPLFKNAYQALKEGELHVHTLVSVTLATCLVMQYYFIYNMAGFFYVLSRKLLMKVQNESQQGLIDIFKLQPRSVWVLVDGVEVETHFEALKKGDLVIIHAGEVIPVDGTVVDGYASIDQHILTGEAQPAEKGSGDPVLASTVVLTGQICIQVEKAGQETVVAQIGQILNQTANFKTDTQLQAEESANKTVLPTLVVGAFSLPFLGAEGAATVLASHFGHRMSVIAPISIFNFFRLLSEHGVLIKDGQTLDTLTRVDTIVFDKTGTLTQTQPYVGQVIACSTYETLDVLLYAAAAEYKQTHPIALAILKEAKVRQLNVPSIDEAEYKVGYGLTVTIDDKLIRVGSARFISMEGISIPAHISQAQEYCHREGHSLVMVAINDELAGAIELLPTIRPEAKEIINQLRERNIQSIYIISGDHEIPTKKLAAEVGIEHYFAETLPQNKAQLIEQLQKEGQVVCYVGDGINDSIALKQADVSISLRGASTIATDTAQIILMSESLNQLPFLFDVAQEFNANIRNSFRIILLPTIIGISSAFLLHLGLLQIIILKQIGFAASLTNAMLPLVRQSKDHAAI